MNWHDAYLVSENLNQETHDDVDRLEAYLGVKMPDGYRDYVTRFGAGEYCDFLRVYSTNSIQERLGKFRERWQQYYFWDKGKDKLSKEQLIECIIFADTIEGDEFIFHPDNPKQLYILPRHDEDIFLAGKSLGELVDWLFGSGELYNIYDGLRFIKSYINRDGIIFIKKGIVVGFYETLAHQLLELEHHHHEVTGEGIRFYAKDFWGDCYIHTYLNADFYEGRVSYDMDKGLRNPILAQYIAKFVELGFSYQTNAKNKEMEEWLIQLKNNVK